MCTSLHFCINILILNLNSTGSYSSPSFKSFEYCLCSYTIAATFFDILSILQNQNIWEINKSKRGYNHTKINIFLGITFKPSIWWIDSKTSFIVQHEIKCKFFKKLVYLANCYFLIQCAVVVLSQKLLITISCSINYTMTWD